MRAFEDPLTVDHPLIRDGITCPICRLAFVVGDIVSLVAVPGQTTRVQVAMAVHGHCRLKTSPVPESACPFCGVVQTHATSVQGDCTPEVGDLTICRDCTGVLQFGFDLSLEPAALSLLSDEERILVTVAQEAVRQYQASRVKH